MPTHDKTSEDFLRDLGNRPQDTWSGTDISRLFLIAIGCNNLRPAPSADRAQEATGKYKFRFEGRTYYTDQRRMTVAQMLFITDGRTEGHVFQQDHDSQPRRYLDHGDKIDMTCEPWLFIDLPARM